MSEPLQPTPDQLSHVELAILRLLVFVHPATLNIEYLRHRLHLQVSPRDAAESLVVRGLIELAEGQAGRLEEWRATRAGIAREERIAKEQPLPPSPSSFPNRVPIGRYRPRPFDHLCPPRCDE